MKDGFAGSATLQVLGGRLDYQGRANPLAEGYGIDGTLALRATDAAPLAGASGLPAAAMASGVVVVDTPVTWGDGKWSFPQIAGRLGDHQESQRLVEDRHDAAPGH